MVGSIELLNRKERQMKNTHEVAQEISDKTPYTYEEVMHMPMVSLIAVMQEYGITFKEEKK